MPENNDALTKVITDAFLPTDSKGALAGNAPAISLTSISKSLERIAVALERLATAAEKAP